MMMALLAMEGGKIETQERLVHSAHLCMRSEPTVSHGGAILLIICMGIQIEEMLGMVSPGDGDLRIYFQAALCLLGLLLSLDPDETSDRPLQAMHSS